MFNISNDFGVLMDDGNDLDDTLQPSQDREAVTNEGHAVQDMVVQNNFS